jgi:cellulose synthase/poly-beta-1,6-N-acetylglucosamine synthase-like glycosyltransferase
MNTSLAILDAVSEEINNHIFRKGHRVLGLSSAIIGSGMAFDYHFFKNLMLNIKAIGGFDKEIELKLLHDGYKIEYLHDAVVFDEKVQKAEVFSNQRRRWLSAQLHYFRQDILKATKALLLKGNVDYFDKAIQFIQPPRILLLGAVILFGMLFISVNLLVANQPVYWMIWAGIMVACMLAFLFSIPRTFYNVETLKAMAGIPKGMLLMFGSLMKIKGANKKFIHTQHGVINKADKK